MTAALRLYETADALDVVRSWIQEHQDEIIAGGGEMPPELLALLEQAEGDFATKVERVGLYVRELVTTAAAVKVEADRLAAIVRHHEKAAEQLKAYLLFNLQRAGEEKIKGKLVTVRRQVNPPSVKCSRTSEELAGLVNIPECTPFIRVVPASYSIDAAAVKAAEKEGRDVPINGVTIERGEHVRVQ